MSDITQYFDTTNQDHINAFIHLTEKGAWPEEFYNTAEANGVTFPNCWQFSLMSKLAVEYINTLKVEPSPYMTVEITGIKWDSSEATYLFPDLILYVPRDLAGDNLHEYIENRLSDEYGFTHEGWESLEILN